MDFVLKTDFLDVLIEVVEIDENDDGAFRTSIALDFRHPTGLFRYAASDIWFETRVWDKFEEGVSRFAAPETEKTSLHDMSQQFTIEIAKQVNSLQAYVRLEEPMIGGGMCELRFTKRIDLDSSFMHKLNEALVACPKYW